MQKIVVATQNPGKIKEIKEILANMPYEVVSMGEAGIDLDIVEDGATYEENAMIKARALAKLTGSIVIADDSGLAVDALDGAPGVYSARFAGEGASSKERNQKLLCLMQGVKNRRAKFICSIAVIFPDGNSFIVTGECHGMIAEKEVGQNGFAYDPLFYVPEMNKTMAELDGQEKNKISHRGRALEKMREELKKITSR
jgi:XTP/dITP diphosphohydrolase